MARHEFDPVEHERYVSERFLEAAKSVARVAIFDELIDMYHDGQCSFEEAIDQYLHDINRDGIGYEQAA